MTQSRIPPNIVQTLISYRKTRSKEGADSAHQVAEHLSVPVDVIIYAMRQLERRHLGRLILGRYGRPTRFEWSQSFDPRGEVGRSLPAPPGSEPGAITIPPPAPTGIDASNGALHIPIPLGEGMQGMLNVPSSVTPANLHAAVTFLNDIVRVLERASTLPAPVPEEKDHAFGKS